MDFCLLPCCFPFQSHWRQKKCVRQNRWWTESMPSIPRGRWERTSFICSSGLCPSLFQARVYNETFYLIGNFEKPDSYLIQRTKLHLKNSKIPEHFDARKRWPKCPEIERVHSQGSCGSCWAVSSAAAISDRVCIATNGSFKESLSSQQPLSCVDDGCEGKSNSIVWDYWMKNGLVTEACQPYVSRNREVPPCSQNCTTGHTSSKRYYASEVYEIENSMENIQREIMDNGPLVMVFDVFSDFFAYKKGVYISTTDQKESLHAVKAIGWGSENGTPYWLLVNSWGSHWGEQGLFRFLRGHNHCRIESYVRKVGV